MFGSCMTPSVPVVADMNGSNGGYGAGWWVIILIFALLGWGGRGFGFGGGGNGCDSACASVGDVERGFNQQSTNMRFNALDNAFAQTGYQNQAGFNSVNQGICQLGYQLQSDLASIQAQNADCCCQTQRAIDGVNYNMAQNFCQLGNTVQSSARDIIDAQNANYRALHDEIVQNRMADMQQQIQALNTSVANQNLRNDLINTLRPCPVPSYQTCNPWATNGTSYNSCCC